MHSGRRGKHSTVKQLNRRRPLRLNEPESIIKEQQEQNLRRRIERFDEELGRLNSPNLRRRSLNERKHQIQQEVLSEQESLLEAVSNRIEELRLENNLHSQSLDSARGRLQTAKGRLASLEALQEAALGKQGEGVIEWLDERGAADAERLAQVIEVDPGWERAVESVLGFSSAIGWHQPVG